MKLTDGGNPIEQMESIEQMRIIEKGYPMSSIPANQVNPVSTSQARWMMFGIM